LGVMTTLAVIMHEIPQEIGDFGVLLHAGFETKKALMFNLLSAFAAVGGAVVGYFLVASSAHIGVYLLPIAAGGFLYIAASDLLPEIRKEAVSPRLFLNFAVFLIGILFVLLIKEPR
jgi:zinc and cadmium transporter